MNKIRWGVLGAGQIAEKFASDLKTVEDAELVAVASKMLPKAQAFAEKFNVPEVYGNYRDFIEHNTVDAVYIATTHNFHFENAKLCLQNKKNVLCEKPITVNLKQLEKLQAIAKQNNTLLMEAMWTYFLPTLIQAKQWIAEGKIGAVKMLTAEFGFKAPFLPESRLYNKELAGGALLDIGIYPIAFANFFSEKEIKSIKSNAQIGKTEIDEQNAITIEYKSGELAILSSSILAHLRNEAIIYGTNGLIRLPEFWMGTEAFLESETEDLNFSDKRETFGYNFEAEHFGNLIRASQNESNVVSFEVSQNLMKVMDTVRQQNDFSYPFEYAVW